MNKNNIMAAVALVGIVLLAFGRIPTPFSIILAAALGVAVYRSYLKAEALKFIEEQQEED